MQELTLETMIAVLEEIFGRGLFWTLVLVMILGALAYLYVLFRDRAISWRKFLLAQLAMPVGAVLAVWFVMLMTDSRLSDLGGPVDVIVFLVVAMLGAIGTGIVVYTLQSLFFGKVESG